MEPGIVKNSVMLGFLFVLAWIDWKKRELPLTLLGMFACCGILLELMDSGVSWKGMLGGALVGGILLVAALFTGESVGTGDALLFCAAGIYLGVWQNLLLLFLSSVCAAVCAMILFLKKRCSKKARIPFVPFVLTADVLMQALTKQGGFG